MSSKPDPWAMRWRPRYRRRAVGVPVKEPAAWSYELAQHRAADGTYCHWAKCLTFFKPNVPEGSIRNLVALYPAAPCVFECRTADGSVLGAGRAWCQSHGFACPELLRRVAP